MIDPWRGPVQAADKIGHVQGSGRGPTQAAGALGRRSVTSDAVGAAAQSFGSYLQIY